MHPLPGFAAALGTGGLQQPELEVQSYRSQTAVYTKAWAVSSVLAWQWTTCWCLVATNGHSGRPLLTHALYAAISTVCF